MPPSARQTLNLEETANYRNFGIPYFFQSKAGFPLQINPKNLDPSYKTDLEF